MNAKPLSFSVSVGNEVSDADWANVSALFSSEYGVYSAAAPGRAGERIRLGTGYYRRAYANGQYRVALCRDGDRLVAHAIHLERMTSRGQVALVVQLVVAGPYRRQGVASTLLHAIWGFSNYYAWGIVSSNAFTIGALESATFRKCILVDERRRLVCHKEQFPFGKGLPSGEFLIWDRRFTAAEISAWLEAAGLKVVQTRFVRAGFKVEYAVSTGKEILLFARKGSK